MSTLTMQQNPLVSVVIPTRSDRRNMFARAVECFKRQNYFPLELVVVEDGPTSNLDLVRNIECKSRVIVHAAFANLAQKRNFANTLASGEFICHFDDDDWHSPYRVKDQLSYFVEGIDMVGYGRTMWFDTVRNEAYLYKGAPWGASIMYRRSYWTKNLFNADMNMAEDAPFIATARKVIVDAGHNMVATQHSRNTPRTYDDINGWEKISKLQLPSGFYSVA